jgi:hypothetical protein
MAVMVKPGVAAADTVKLCVTGVAAEYALLPACDARMVQVPGVTIVAAAPETVHTLEVREAKLTGRPELAEAVSATDAPTDCAGMGLKAMVWDCWALKRTELSELDDPEFVFPAASAAQPGCTDATTVPDPLIPLTLTFQAVPLFGAILLTEAVAGAAVPLKAMQELVKPLTGSLN